jgi:hypothetical protein
VAYAQRAGATADDGGGANSPYTTALLNHLPTPGLDIELALRRVRDDVLKATRNKQEPFKYGSLGGAEIPLVPTMEPQQAATPPKLATRTVRSGYGEIDERSLPPNTLVAYAQHSLGGAEIPLVPGKGFEPAAAASPKPAADYAKEMEIAFWNAIKDAKSKELLQTYALSHCTQRLGGIGRSGEMSSLTRAFRVSLFARLV